MPRFAILTHDWPTLHWDLLLEDGDVLLSWRLLHEPTPGTIPAERLQDHRPFYLDYVGPVSGNRGSVMCFDAGTFEWLERTDHTLDVQLLGMKFTGRWRLIFDDERWNCEVSV